MFQFAKWCNPVISEAMVSYNHASRLCEHMGSILLLLCLFQFLIDFHLFQPIRHVPFRKGWSDKSCLLIVKVIYLSSYFLRTSVNCSWHGRNLFNGGMILFNSRFLALDSTTLYPLVIKGIPIATLIIDNGVLWLIGWLIK